MDESTATVTLWAKDLTPFSRK